MKRTLLLLAVAILTLSATAYAAKPIVEIPDTQLANRVRGALHATFGATAWKIAVTAEDGFVFLYGEVATEPVRARATEIAAGVAGVRGVNNELSVAPGG